MSSQSCGRRRKHQVAECIGQPVSREGQNVVGGTYDAAKDEPLVDGAHDATPGELPRHGGGCGGGLAGECQEGINRTQDKSRGEGRRRVKMPECSRHCF